MKLDVNEMYLLTMDILSKNIQQGYVSPDEWNRAINMAQNNYVAYLLGNFQQYRPGKPIAVVEFGQNAVIRQRLTPIIKTGTLTINGSGMANYPPDYMQTDAMLTTDNKRVRQIQQDYWYFVLGSKIDPVQTNPIFKLLDTGFEFAPTNLGSAKLSYISRPTEIRWAYTIDPITDEPVYDSAASEQPVWDNTSILEIMVRALQRFGVSLQFNDVVRYSQEIKTTGQ